MRIREISCAYSIIAASSGPGALQRRFAIALRFVAGPAETFDIAARIAEAQHFREQVVTDSDAYRLVHAEADRLPALIIDRYGDAFSVQALDQGMDKVLPEIAAALEEQFQPRAIVARNDAAVRSLEQLPREITLLVVSSKNPSPFT